MSIHTWVINETDEAVVSRIMIENGLSRPVASVLAGRGITVRSNIQRLMHPSWPAWGDVRSSLPDLDRAVGRIKNAVERKQRILVYGDRDVDGITATAIMVRTLADLGAAVCWYVPGDEGYGMKQEVLEGFVGKIDLVITVDCGITACPEAAFLKQHSIDLVITDHHEQSGLLPEAIAVVDPKRTDADCPERSIAGCAVAFILCQELMLTYSKYYDDRVVAVTEHNGCWETTRIERFNPSDDAVFDMQDAVIIAGDERTRQLLLSRDDIRIDPERIIMHSVPGCAGSHALAVSWIDAQVYKDPRMGYYRDQLSAFAALGSLADMVPLSGLTRCIINQGLRALRRSACQGLKALSRYIDGADHLSNSPVSSEAVSWRYAPLLNAAGRCGKAHEAVALLLAETAAKASRALDTLCSLNETRKALLAKNTERFEALIEEQFVPETDRLLFVVADNIPHGVSGIIANRMVRRHNRPAALMIREGDRVTGTIRSAGDFNILVALEQCAELLTTFGGHEKAAGFSLLTQNLSSFNDRIKAIAADAVKKEDMVPVVRIDAVVKAEDLSWDVIRELQMFEPFGTDWGYPVFCVKDIQVRSIAMLGSSGRHLRMKVAGEKQRIDTVAWDMGERMQEISGTGRLDLVVKLEVNRFNGKESLRLNLVDIRPAETARVAV